MALKKTIKATRKRVTSSLRKAWPKKRGVQAAAVAAITILVACGVLGGLYAAGVMESPRLDALFGKEQASGSITFDEPGSGALVSEGQRFGGTYQGSGAVYLWVVGVNHAVPVDAAGGEWTYKYEGGLAGERTIGVAVLKDGAWGAMATRALQFDAVAERDRVTDNWNPTARRIFQPIEKGIEAVVSFVTEGANMITGRGSGDLDNDGVPDRWQGSTVSPRSQVHVPYTTLALGVVALALVAAATYLFQAKAVNQILKQRIEQRHAERIAAKRSEAEVKKAQLKAAEKGLGIKAKLLSRKLGVQERLAKQKLSTIKELQKQKMDIIKKRGGA